MDYWDEEPHYEPEPQLELGTPQKIDVEVSINSGVIADATNAFINNIMENNLKKHIERQVELCLRNSYESKIKFDNVIKEIITEKINEKYPDVVENKVNEFEEYIKNIKFSDRNFGYSSDTIQSRAAKRVDAYIENELKDSVAKSKEYIEQFSKNYFANNLFKAMGMMDKMLPQTKTGE
jgi:hypothetical protein